jgi:hypothetical protein
MLESLMKKFDDLKKVKVKVEAVSGVPPSFPSSSVCIHPFHPPKTPSILRYSVLSDSLDHRFHPPSYDGVAI